MKNQIFLVVWRDACGGARQGWRDVGDLMLTNPATVWSFGLLLDEDDDRLLLCPHVVMRGDDDMTATQGDAEIAIPKDWVVSKRALGYVEDDGDE